MYYKLIYERITMRLDISSIAVIMEQNLKKLRRHDVWKVNQI